MVSLKDPRLVKLKKKGKAGTRRTVRLGNPDIVQVPLVIEKSSGRVKNLDELKNVVTSAELSELKDLYESLFGKKTKVRKVASLAAKICQHLEAVADGYLEAAGGKEDPPEALAEAAGKEEKRETESREKSSKPHADEGGEWTWTYKGADYTLACLGAKRYRLSGPEGHPACNKIYTSPGAAAKVITGTKSEINGRDRFGMAKSKRALPGTGGNSRRATHRQKMLRPRDPRLPLPGSGFRKVQGGVEYVCTMLEDDRVRVVVEETPESPRTEATYSSVSQAATKIGGANESGYRFFALNQGVDQLDFARAIAGYFVLEGLEMEKFLDKLESYTKADTEYAQKIVDQLSREFYKRQAMKKIEAMLASAKTEPTE